MEVLVRATTPPILVLHVFICSGAHHPKSVTGLKTQTNIWHPSLLEQQLAVVHFGHGFVYAVYPLRVCTGHASDDNGIVATIHTLVGQQILWVDVVSLKSYNLPVPTIFTFLDH